MYNPLDLNNPEEVDGVVPAWRPGPIYRCTGDPELAICPESDDDLNVTEMQERDDDSDQPEIQQTINLGPDGASARATQQQVFRHESSSDSAESETEQKTLITLMRCMMEKTEAEAIQELEKADHLILNKRIGFDVQMAYGKCSLFTMCPCGFNLEYMYLDPLADMERVSECVLRRHCTCIYGGRYKTESVRAGTQLMLVAAALGMVKAMDFLWRHNCSLNTATVMCSLRPLHLAARHGHVTVMNFLLENDSTIWDTWEVSVKETGLTPLMLAVIGNHESMAKELLKHKKDQLNSHTKRGALVRVMDAGHPGDTAISIAVSIKSDSMTHLLQEAGARLGPPCVGTKSSKQ